MEIYQICKIGFYICLAAAILFFVLSIVLFFIFDIRAVFAMRTGRVRAKTIKEMEEVTSASGRLNYNKKGKSGETKAKTPPPKKPQLQQPQSQEPPKPVKAPESTSITEELNIPEASGSDETALLGENRSETSVLSQPGIIGAAETSVLVNTEELIGEADKSFRVVKKLIVTGTDEIIR